MTLQSASTHFTAVKIDGQNVGFQLWSPHIGKVYDRSYAASTATTSIDHARPWFIPAYVIAAAYNSEVGHVIERQHVDQFLRLTAAYSR